jgi:hypothetical protein
MIPSGQNCCQLRFGLKKNPFVLGPKSRHTGAAVSEIRGTFSSTGFGFLAQLRFSKRSSYGAKYGGTNVLGCGDSYDA